MAMRGQGSLSLSTTGRRKALIDRLFFACESAFPAVNSRPCLIGGSARLSDVMSLLASSSKTLMGERQY
jgi:hypothetical protein